MISIFFFFYSYKVLITSFQLKERNTIAYHKESFPNLQYTSFRRRSSEVLQKPRNIFSKSLENRERMSLGSDSSQNGAFLGDAQRNGTDRSDGQISQNDKKANVNFGMAQGRSENSNTNNEMLNFNDNYTAILQNLASDNSHLLSQGFSPNNTGNNMPQSFSSNHETYNHSSVDNTNNSRNNISNDNNTDKQNLDALLQHYQSLLNRSATSTNTNAHPYPPSGDGGAMGFNPASHQSNPDAVNSNIRSTNKSTITERPCDHCRRRQTKCVLVPDLPNCIQCETKGIKCTFSELPNDTYRFTGENNGVTNPNMKKHLRPDENVNIESLLKKAKTYNNENVVKYYTELLQNLNDSISLSNPNHMLNPPPALFPEGVSPEKVPSNSAMLNLLQLNQQEHQQQRQIPQPQGQYPRSSFYVGPTSVYDINLVNHVKLNHIDQIQLSPSVALRKVAPNVQFILRDNFNQELYLKQEQEVDMVEKLVYPHGKVLIDIFFKLIHPCFPILHERVFLEKYARSYRELTAPLLASIYALSLQWWDFHPKLIGFPKPDVIDQLNQIAFRTFFDMIERPKLSMVQTGLLILQCRSECANNWVLCSAVVALAEELGLGIDCQDWRLPRWERGLRRRLAWAVWAQDKWTSLIESRHSHLILGRNWMVKMLTEEDFPTNSPVISGTQEANSGKDSGTTNTLNSISLFDMFPTNEDFIDGTLMFQQMVSLSVILGEVMDTFYTEGAIQVTSKIEEVLKLAKPLQLKLREWYHSLPSQLSMNKFVPRKFNANATLTLAYFAAEITLHRKIISTLKQDTPKELVQVCRTAAKTRLVAAIEFVRDLKNEHINAFWYACSTGNLMLIGTFAALLYVTAKTKDEAIIFRDCLRNYVWILRVGSKSFDRAANALKRIHILLTQVPGLLTDEQPKEFIPARSQSPMYQSQQWKMSSAMDSQQSPLNLNQLRNLPSDILQTLTNMQGNSPNLLQSKNINQSSSPTFSSARPDISGQLYNENNNENSNKSLIGSNVSPNGISPRDEHSLSKQGSGSSAKTILSNQENLQGSPAVIEGSAHVNSLEKGPLAASATQNGRGKPITPQSVGGTNIMKETPPLANTENNSEKISDDGSPTSVQGRKEPSNNGKETQSIDGELDTDLLRPSNIPGPAATTIEDKSTDVEGQHPGSS